MVKNPRKGDTTSTLPNGVRTMLFSRVLRNEMPWVAASIAFVYLILALCEILFFKKPFFILMYGLCITVGITGLLLYEEHRYGRSNGIRPTSTAAIALAALASGCNSSLSWMVELPCFFFCAFAGVAVWRQTKNRVTGVFAGLLYVITSTVIYITGVLFTLLAAYLINDISTGRIFRAFLCLVFMGIIFGFVMTPHVVTMWISERRYRASG